MRLRWWIFWGFVAWAAIANPHAAATAAHALGHFLNLAVRRISLFFADL